MASIRRISTGRTRNRFASMEPFKEGSHSLRYEFKLFFQYEVAGIEQVKLNILQVSSIRMRAIGREDFIVLSPHDQLQIGWRPLVGGQCCFSVIKSLTVCWHTKTRNGRQAEEQLPVAEGAEFNAAKRAACTAR